MRQIMSRSSVLILLSIAMLWPLHCLADASAPSPTVNDAAIKVKWGYKGNLGPAYWGHLNPSFSLCDTGRAQSPINIEQPFEDLDETAQFDYHPATLTIMDNGPTALKLGKTQVIINSAHSIQLNFAAAGNETLTLGDKPYQLVQLHFHSPSEHQLQGSSFPLEMHFVHQSNDGQLAIVAVLVTAGIINSSLQNIIDHLPPSEGIAMEIAGDYLNPGTLLPPQPDYYEYKGSLTVPPCSENIHWIVMAQPMTASPGQIQILRNAAGGVNARPVRPLNNRVIYYSKNLTKVE